MEETICIARIDRMLETDERPDWRTIFGNKRTLKVEIGPGKGEFLIQSAKREPETNFVAIEIRRKRVEKINSKVAREGIDNAKVLLGDARHIDFLFAPESVETFFIHFPDPWPKRRHGKHRLIDAGFVQKLHSLLAPSGKVYMTTDADFYAQAMVHLFTQHEGFVTDYMESGATRSPYHNTIHEWKFKLWGRNIYYFCFTKNNGR